MYGRVPTSKCWRWTGGTSRTCSTLQIPRPEISCKSSSNAERRCRHSIIQWGPQVRTITSELLLFSRPAGPLRKFLFDLNQIQGSRAQTIVMISSRGHLRCTALPRQRTSSSAATASAEQTAKVSKVDVLEGGCSHEIDARFDGCCSYVLCRSGTICGVSQDRRGGIRYLLYRQRAAKNR